MQHRFDLDRHGKDVLDGENMEVNVRLKQLADSKETSLMKGEAGLGPSPSLGCAGFKEHSQKSRKQCKEEDSNSQTQLHSIC